MTHDELLARIIGAPKRLTDLFPETVEAHLMPNTKALRAVVELCKDPEDFGNGIALIRVSDVIQAIEEQIK